ncbi:ankyrin repeat-containing domain protein [Mycena leptocephala]|nr:ankyrin repeat-containing domain protein [Mycena leptocephala]
MANIVGLVATVLQLVDTVASARIFYNEFRDAPTDMLRLLLEIQSLESLIEKFRERIDKSEGSGVPGGTIQEIEEPLTQLTGTMERLTKKLDSHKVTSRLAWPLWGKEDVQEGLNSIERFKSSISVWLGMNISAAVEDVAEERRADHGYTMRSVKTLAQDEREHYEHTISTLKNGDEEHRLAHAYIAKSVRDGKKYQQECYKLEERNKIMKWYSPVNYFLRQADIFSTRQPGTGQWLLEDAQFREWKSGTGKTLWCRGMPGAGKTVLVSIVVDHLRRDLESEDIGVAVIYLNHKETDDHSIKMLLASLWRQLILKKSISPALRELYNDHCEKGTGPSADEAQAILSSIILEYSKVFILVDALDEYPEQQRDALLRRISALEPTVNLMLTSRPHITFAHIISTADLETLEMKATEDDIRRYIDAQIMNSSRLSKYISMRPTLRDEIETKIVNRSGGMFLLAKLHVDSLTRKLKVRDVYEALANIPGDLNSTYDGVIERINEQSSDEKALAWRVLSWVTNVKRPLQPSELREALAVEPETKELDQDNIFDMETILSACAGLVIVSEEDDKIRLVHFTTQDYLQQKQAQNFLRASTEITMTCITYLSYPFFEEFLQQAKLGALHYRNRQQVIDRLFHQNPLLDYAVTYWFAHANEQTQIGIRSSILSFLENCYAWRMIFKTRFLLQHDFRSELLDPNCTILLRAAAFHLKGICHYLIKKAGAGTMGELLHAARLRRLDIVEVLLDSGVDVDSVYPGSSDTTMHFALGAAERDNWVSQECYNRDLVWLLVERGADVNTRAGDFGTALNIASHYGDYELARLVIEHGAKLSVPKRWKGPCYPVAPLYEAASKGHIDICRLLLERGADVNEKETDGYTALHVASDQYAIWRLLLEHGADVNLKTKDGWTALHAASMYGAYETCCLLLEHGADVNASGECRHWSGGHNALDNASRGGYHRLCQLLIEHGADVNADYGIALRSASRLGRYEVISLLIEHGADVNTKDGCDGSALTAASCTGELQQLSVVPGNVGKRGRDCGMALSAASGEGHHHVVRLLLEHGADVNAEGGIPHSDPGVIPYSRLWGIPRSHLGVTGRESTALYMASSNGHEEIVSLLIDHGAHINTQTGELGTALVAATYKRNCGTIRVLIERGADINGRRADSVTALATASFHGYHEIVGLLVERGADVNAALEGGWPPCALYGAIYSGHHSIVSLLLEHGANPNGPRGDETILSLASRWNETKYVAVLLKHGAKINARSRNHETALHTAARANCTSTAELLIENGADVEAEKYGETALHIALSLGARQSRTMVDLLIRHGAVVDTRAAALLANYETNRQSFYR